MEMTKDYYRSLYWYFRQTLLSTIKTETGREAHS